MWAVRGPTMLSDSMPVVITWTSTVAATRLFWRRRAVWLLAPPDSYTLSVAPPTPWFDAMVQVLDGKAEFTIEGKPFPLVAGQMLIMPANKPHAVNAVERFKMLLTMIKS